ncbi:l-type lectin-domain containing receptor kinase ix.1 [Quercus suber]|uniref:non-specific serine/threonine protein kinase n=1 Tax=Quercus suber TaxID=58331 RepID=A0AAW0KUB1_QUESU
MVFQAPKLRIIYLLISIFLLLINPCATQIFFNYTDFSQTINNKPIIRTGNATISGSVIQLTPDEVDNWGRATYSEQMHLWDEKSEKVASFTSNFSFIIYSQGKYRYSDGIMFFLSTPNFPAPKPTDGAGLGLLSRRQMGQPSFLAANKFVAVEFDTFRNEEFDLDSVGEHVGININNMKSEISTPWYCTITENRTYSASINYDSSTQNLSVTFTGFNYDNTPIQQNLSLVINLTDHLPESVEFGFSASTGLISELHILSTWSFESTSPSTIQRSPAAPVGKNKDEPKTKLVVGLSLASALQYLHEEWEQCVLHRDIKSSNILLDSNLNAKLGDFGLARLVDHVKGSQTSALAGTWGYLAPECIMSGRASKETDVYSFGIVVLEIACGRKPAEPDAKQDEIIMLEWVWELYGARNLLKAADPRLGGDFDEPQMERLIAVGLWCAHPDYNARPSIRKVIHVLDFEDTLPILEPKLPVTTFLSLPSTASTSSTSKSENHDA